MLPAQRKLCFITLAPRLNYGSAVEGWSDGMISLQHLYTESSLTDLAMLEWCDSDMTEAGVVDGTGCCCCCCCVTPMS